jgi:predicted permease
MSATFLALAPVFLIIALGWALKRSGFPGDEIWPLGERLTYYLLFPALLVHSLASANFGGFRILPLAAALVTTVLIASLTLIALRSRLGAEGPAFTSVLQGAIRGSVYVGMAAALGLWGSAGLVLAAVAIAVLVPTVNLVSVAVLSRYAGEVRPGATLGALARNPLILACVAGILLNWSGLGLPPGLDRAIELLGRAALPLGLLAVGAGLELEAVRAAGRQVVAACAVKLVAMPLLAALACWAFRVEGLTAAVAVLFTALPSSPAAFVLAREMGGDAPLMAAIIALSVLLAALTMPAMLGLLT